MFLVTALIFYFLSLFLVGRVMWGRAKRASQWVLHFLKCELSGLITSGTLSSEAAFLVNIENVTISFPFYSVSVLIHFILGWNFYGENSHHWRRGSRKSCGGRKVVDALLPLPLTSFELSPLDLCPPFLTEICPTSCSLKFRKLPWCFVQLALFRTWKSPPPSVWLKACILKDLFVEVLVNNWESNCE